MRTTEIYDPRLYVSFDLISFLYHTLSMENVKESLILDIQHLKETYPDNPKTSERVTILMERVKSLEWTITWIRNLEKEYNAERKCSFDNRMDNLYLIADINRLTEENQKLTKLLENT